MKRWLGSGPIVRATPRTLVSCNESCRVHRNLHPAQNACAVQYILCKQGACARIFRTAEEQLEASATISLPILFVNRTDPRAKGRHEIFYVQKATVKRYTSNGSKADVSSIHIAGVFPSYRRFPMLLGPLATPAPTALTIAQLPWSDPAWYLGTAPATSALQFSVLHSPHLLAERRCMQATQCQAGGSGCWSSCGYRLPLHRCPALVSCQKTCTATRMSSLLVCIVSYQPNSSSPR